MTAQPSRHYDIVITLDEPAGDPIRLSQEQVDLLLDACGPVPEGWAAGEGMTVIGYAQASDDGPLWHHETVLDGQAGEDALSWLLNQAIRAALDERE